MSVRSFANMLAGVRSGVGENGISLEEMARDLCMQPSALAAIESGAAPVPDGLIPRICGAYHLDWDFEAYLRKVLAEPD